MNKKMKKLARRYIGIFVMLFLLIFGAWTFYRDVTSKAADMAADHLSDDASIFTMYIDDMLKEKMVRLEHVADAISLAVQNDVQRSKEILEENRNYFDRLLVLDLEGKRILGDEVLFNLVQSNMLDDLIAERQSIVFQDLVKDAEQNRYVVMCTPIVYQSRVISIMVGAVHVESLTKLTERWNDTQNGCAFIVTPKGDYITEGEEFEDLLGEEANNFLTYLSYCKMAAGSPSRETIEWNMQKRQSFTFRYKYNSDNYICNMQPCMYGDWYMAYPQKESSVYRDTFNLGRKTLYIGLIAIVFFGLLMVFFAVDIYRNEEYREYMERQRLLDDLERSIVFEYNFFPKELHFYGDGEKMFGKKIQTYYGEEVYEIYDFIHPDDASVRGRIHRFYDDDANMFTAEVRIQNNNGYGWYRIIGKLVKDKRFGSNVKFIGKIESADKEIAEEKNLVERAENDLLTGVLNKKTMEEKVAKCLTEVKGSIHCIFFMIDLDNFKNVNDKLGHISGDKAIVDTANRLQEVFPKNAFVGRLGGDEFAVCATYDAFDEESLHKYIKTKAEKICEVNRRTYSNGEIEVNISSSVGIALAPDQATQFEELYKKADNAMYQSKNGGKNCYHMYQG